MMQRTKVSAWVFALGVCAAPLFGQVITTVAGTDWIFPAQILPALNAPLGAINGVAVDSNGNVLVTDPSNRMVMRISPDGTLHVIAGNGGNATYSGDGGPATNAGLGELIGVVADKSGSVYLVDGNRIRKVAVDGTITTFAGSGAFGASGDGGPARDAALYDPWGVAVDAAGNVYIADRFNNRIRQVALDGTIRTVAGTGSEGVSGDGGPATNATLRQPLAVAVDRNGSLFISDGGNLRVRMVMTDGTITTIAGNGKSGVAANGGKATDSALGSIYALTVDDAGNVYLADHSYHTIWKVAPSGTIIAVAGGNGGFSGDGGPAVGASLNSPSGVAVDSVGNLLVADSGNGRIRLVTPAGKITTTAGNGNYHFSGDAGPATNATLSAPSGLALDVNGDLIFADAANHRVRKVTSADTITTVAGSGVVGSSGDGGLATDASLVYPDAVAVDPFGNIFVADEAANIVRKVTPGGTITTAVGTGRAGFAGDGGRAQNALLNQPNSLAMDAAGNLFVGGFQAVRKVTPDGFISTVAGNGGFINTPLVDGGPATAGPLQSAGVIAVDLNGNLLIGESGTNSVRKVTPNGIISTIAGNGRRGFSGDGGPANSASLDYPSGLAVDSGGDVFIADANTKRIRVVTPDGKIDTVAGNGSGQSSGDGGPPKNAGFGSPWALAADASGDLFIADSLPYGVFGYNPRIREIVAAPAALAASPTKLTFAAASGGATPTAQSISLSSSISGLSFTASTSAIWLGVSPSSGSMPAFLTVSTNPASLVAGTYQGTVTITAPNAVPSTTAVAVTLIVQPGVPGTLGVDTQNVSFTVAQGSGALTQQLRVLNTGGGSLSFTAAVAAGGTSWLTISPASGTATPSSPASLTVTAAPGWLVPGTYCGTVTITGAGSTINLPVTLSVSAPTAIILVSQSGLSFTAVAQGGVPLPQNFGILNTGQGSMSWTATATTLSGGNWLQISPSNRTVQRPYLDVSLVTVSIDPSTLAAGTYYGRIQVAATAANTPQVMTVILTVLPAG